MKVNIKELQNRTRSANEDADTRIIMEIRDVIALCDALVEAEKALESTKLHHMNFGVDPLCGCISCLAYESIRAKVEFK